MFYKVEMDHCHAPETPVGGCGCDWRGTISQVAEIGDCSLTPGDASPAGRCPECDGLVYVETEKTRMEDAASTMLEALYTVAGKLGSLTDAENDNQREHILADMKATVSSAIAATTNTSASEATANPAPADDDNETCWNTYKDDEGQWWAEEWESGEPTGYVIGPFGTQRKAVAAIPL